MSYAIPVDELSIAKMTEFRTNAKEAALERAKKLALVTKMEELVFREGFPATDFGLPAGTGYTNEAYITGAAVANAWTSVFDTAAVPQLGNNKVAVFYKIADITPAPVCTAVRFRLGPTGTSTLAWFHIEQFINVKLTAEVWLSEPVVYNKDQWLFIEFYPRVNTAAERLAFGCFIAEPVGEAIS